MATRAAFFKESRMKPSDATKPDRKSGRAMLERLRTLGVVIDPKQENYDYGRFAWFNDLEGNRVELWEPPGIPES